MSWKQTLKLWFFTFFKIPLIFYTKPRVVYIDDNRCEVIIPLKRRNKNHLRSMYFGTFAVGADCTGGLIAMNAINKSGKNISLSFKDFKANFLKLAYDDVHFICEDGKAILETLNQTLKTGERVNHTIPITATCRNETVATFELTLSLKAKKN